STSQAQDFRFQWPFSVVSWRAQGRVACGDARRYRRTRAGQSRMRASEKEDKRMMGLMMSHERYVREKRGLTRVGSRLTLAILALCVAAYAQTQPQMPRTIIRCGTLIDGLSEQPMKDVRIVIEGEKIVTLMQSRGPAGPGETGA